MQFRTITQQISENFRSKICWSIHTRNESTWLKSNQMLIIFKLAESWWLVVIWQLLSSWLCEHAVKFTMVFVTCICFLHYPEHVTLEGTYLDTSGVSKIGTNNKTIWDKKSQLRRNPFFCVFVCKSFLWGVMLCTKTQKERYAKFCSTIVMMTVPVKKL